jgi:WD40 repeat protein
VAFSRNGKLLATADADGTMRLWDLTTGKPPEVLHTSTSAVSNRGVAGVAFSPDGTLLAGAGGDDTVRLWDPATGQQVRVLHATSARFGVTAVAFSPHGTLLAGASGDGTVRLWDPATGQAIRILHALAPGNYIPVSGVAFSANGKLLASVMATVRLWDPATGQALGVPFGPGNPPVEVDTMAFSPDGRLLVSADIGGTVRFWRVSAFTNPYAALCADVGAPTHQEWKQYAAGVPQPSICS